MRFCTTHRACETAEDDTCEVVAVWWTPEPCTLDDALIIVKVDGEWPEWARNIIEDATGGLLPNRIVLDALAQAAKGTR